MTRFHIVRTRHGVLIAPATHDVVRAFLERFVPVSMWKPLYHTDAVLLSLELAGIEPAFATMLGHHGEICKRCATGSACTEVKYASKEAMPTRKKSKPIDTVHVLYALDAANNACLLISDPRKGFAPFFRKNFVLEHHYDEEILAWYIDEYQRKAVLVSLARYERFSAWCSPCQNCSACPEWDEKLLRAEGYKPKSAAGKPLRLSTSTADAEAARILGVRLNASASEIQAAFRKKALHSHPDHGGTQAQMIKLISARERLLKDA